MTAFQRSAAGLRGLFPEAARLAEAVVLVVVVVVVGVVLDGAVVEEGLGEAVPVLHGAEAEAGGVEDVHARDAHLAQVRLGAEPLLRASSMSAAMTSGS
jgi:hypothetical protein